MLSEWLAPSELHVCTFSFSLYCTQCTARCFTEFIFPSRFPWVAQGSFCRSLPSLSTCFLVYFCWMTDPYSYLVYCKSWCIALFRSVFPKNIVIFFLILNASFYLYDRLEILSVIIHNLKLWFILYTQCRFTCGAHVLIGLISVNFEREEKQLYIWKPRRFFFLVWKSKDNEIVTFLSVPDVFVSREWQT